MLKCEADQLGTVLWLKPSATAVVAIGWVEDFWNPKLHTGGVTMERLVKQDTMVRTLTFKDDGVVVAVDLLLTPVTAAISTASS